MISRLVIMVGTPLIISLVLTPWVMHLATLVGAIDHPNARKIHSHPIPRLGGVSIYFSVFLSALLLVWIDPTHSSLSWISSHQGLMLIGSLLLVLLLGIWDDLQALNPGQKFLVQVIAATIAYMAGFRISSITNPLAGEGLLNLGMLDYPVTVLWIVGVSNAFNLIDGLDGLASGVAIIASLTVASVAFLNGETAIAFPVFLLAGALLGFLWYNFNPARIFLGDSGSLFIGFILATVSIQASTKGSTTFAILVPVLALGFPIMDTLLSMVRRFLGSLLPENPRSGSLLHKMHLMFLPDRKHIHHQLIARGLSHRKAVLVLYCVSCMFGLGAFAVTTLNNLHASVILVAVAFATVAGIRQLRYREMAILRNGLLLPLYDGPVMNRGLVQAFLDLAFISFAFLLAYHLAFRGDNVQSLRELAPILILACGIQIAAFFFSGLYRGTFRYLGVGDLLKIVQAVTVAVAATGVVLSLLPPPWYFADLAVLITNFYLLLTFIAGSRCSYHILNFIFRREPKGDLGVLIYGANAQGVLALQHLLHDNHERLTPLGFLDDAPQLEGKHINGYPVFGGHWRIPSLTRKFKINQIVISQGSVRPEVLTRMQQFGEQFGFVIRRSRILMEEIAPSHFTTPRQHTTAAGFENNEPSITLTAQ